MPAILKECRRSLAKGDHLSSMALSTNFLTSSYLYKIVPPTPHPAIRQNPLAPEPLQRTRGYFQQLPDLITFQPRLHRVRHLYQPCQIGQQRHPETLQILLCHNLHFHYSKMNNRNYQSYSHIHWVPALLRIVAR